LAQEKQNRELSWQVAMLTRGSGAIAAAEAGRAPGRLGIGGPPGSVAVAVPAAGVDGGEARPVALATGWVLRHRRRLMAIYVVALHALVYICATMLSRCSHAASNAGAAG
jgi:hypothetical protein